MQVCKLYVVFIACESVDASRVVNNDVIVAVVVKLQIVAIDNSLVAVVYALKTVISSVIDGESHGVERCHEDGEDEKCAVFHVMLNFFVKYSVFQGEQKIKIDFFGKNHLKFQYYS